VLNVIIPIDLLRGIMARKTHWIVLCFTFSMISRPCLLVEPLLAAPYLTGHEHLWFG
jgi:hypothetical protein